MGFPDQPSGQGQPGYPGDQPTIGWQQPGYEQPGGYQQPGGFGQPVGYQQPGAPGWTGGPGYQPGIPGVKSNSLAITALICGVVQFLLWFLFLVPGFIAAALAMIFGLVSMKQMASRGEGGRGMAIAGIILGALGVLGGIILILLIAVGIHTSGTYQYNP